MCVCICYCRFYCNLHVVSQYGQLMGHCNGKCSTAVNGILLFYCGKTRSMKMKFSLLSRDLCPMSADSFYLNGGFYSSVPNYKASSRHQLWLNRSTTSCRDILSLWCFLTTNVEQRLPPQTHSFISHRYISEYRRSCFGWNRKECTRYLKCSFQASPACSFWDKEFLLHLLVKEQTSVKRKELRFDILCNFLCNELLLIHLRLPNSHHMQESCFNSWEIEF